MTIFVLQSRPVGTSTWMAEGFFRTIDGAKAAAKGTEDGNWSLGGTGSIFYYDAKVPSGILAPMHTTDYHICEVPVQ